MPNNSRYIFLKLKERNGEYEYFHPSVHELVDNKESTAEKFAKDYAKTFYFGRAEKANDGYYFHGGEMFVRVNLWGFINKRTFKILEKFL